MQYSTQRFLEGLDESKMTVSSKLIRDSLLNDTYPGRQQIVSEATADITKISLVKEPNGTGVSVMQADGHEYRYAADDLNPKYDTPEKLMAGAQKLLKFRSSGPVLGWLSKNGILYYGSKRDGNGKFPTKEGISKEVHTELHNLIKDLHPDYTNEDIQDAAEAFLEEFGVTTDDDYYRIGPNKIKNSL